MKTNRSKTFLLALCFILIFSCFLSISCKKSCKDKNDDDIKTPVNTYYVTFDANNGTNTNMVSVEENKTVKVIVEIEKDNNKAQLEYEIELGK